MFESIRAGHKYNKLIREWEAFRSAVLRPGVTTPITPDEETGFLELKARLASMMSIVTDTAPRSAAQEARDQVQTMTGLINRYERLETEQLKSKEERDRFEHWWHQSYIFLHKLKGLRGDSDKPASRSGRAAPTGMPSHKAPRRSIPGMGTLRFAVRLALVVVALIVLGRAFGLRWEDLEMRADPPNSVGEFLGSLGQTASSAGSWVAGQFAPVVDVYGVEFTIALVSVLLLAVGYFFFIRTR